MSEYKETLEGIIAEKNEIRADTEGKIASLSSKISNLQ